MLEQLTSLFTVPGVKFVNLQYGDCGNKLASFRAQTGHQVDHWLDSDPVRDLDDFAAQVAALDLVISVDNSTIHLAGALGVPTMAIRGSYAVPCQFAHRDERGGCRYLHAAITSNE